MSEFSGAVARFSSAKERIWRPKTKAVTYGTLAVIGVGGLAASAVMGSPVLTVAAAGGLFRAGKGAWQAFKESKKVPFDSVARSAGVSSNGLWTDLGRDAARGLSDASLIGYHSGANEALHRVQSDSDDPPRLVETAGWSKEKLSGYSRVLQIGTQDADPNAPKNARDFVDGVRQELEGRSFSPTVVAPPRRVVGGVLGGSAASNGGGVARLRSAISAASQQVVVVQSGLSTSAMILADFRDQYQSAIGSSSSGSDVVEALQVAGDAVEEAGSLLSKAVGLANDYGSGLGDR